MLSIDILFGILLLGGVAITFVPNLPGIPLMFLMMVGYGFIEGFNDFHPWYLLIFGGITIASLISDYSSGIIGAKLGGASRKALLAGVVGMFAGLILFPPFGALIGLFIAIFAVEFWQFKNEKRALKAASYSLGATVIGAIFNILLALSFFITYLIIII